METVELPIASYILTKALVQIANEGCMKLYERSSSYPGLSIILKTREE